MNRRGFLFMFGAAMVVPLVGPPSRSRGNDPRPRVKGSLEHVRVKYDPRTKTVKVQP
jgi:hypothetical protein